MNRAHDTAPHSRDDDGVNARDAQAENKLLLRKPTKGPTKETDSKVGSTTLYVCTVVPDRNYTDVSPPLPRLTREEASE